MKLTDGMLSMLEAAERYDDPPQSIGCFPADVGQWSSVRALVRRGLLESAGTGRDINGEHENDVWIFTITELGRAALKDAR